MAGDAPEAEHLIESCPRVSGTVPDRGFIEPGFASYRLVSAFARVCGPFLGWLEVVEVLEAVLTGERARAYLPPKSSFVAAMVLDEVAEPAARELRALVDAFAKVCRDRAGLEPEELLRFLDPSLAGLLEGHDERIEALEADPELRDRLIAHLDHAWTLE